MAKTTNDVMENTDLGLAKDLPRLLELGVDRKRLLRRCCRQGDHPRLAESGGGEGTHPEGSSHKCAASDVCPDQ